MITLKDFWENGGKLAINCKTEEQAKKLCRAFSRMNKTWASGATYKTLVQWDKYGAKTCYTNDGYLADYYYLLKKGFTIYDFSEIKQLDERKPLEATEWVKIVGHEIKDNEITIILSNGKKGVARCNTEDKFDVAIGTELAIARAYKQETAKTEYVYLTTTWHNYPTYYMFFEKHFKNYQDKFIYGDEAKLNKAYKLIGKCEHAFLADEIVCVLQDFKTKQVYLVGEGALKVLKMPKE